LKIDRNGQSPILSDVNYSKIRFHVKERKYKLLLDIAWYTGERWGALVQLRIEDCYNPDGSPREYITFRARTRKASPDGQHKTRQLFIHPVLRESLSNYKPETNSIWLFGDRAGEKPITLRWADKILRDAVRKAGLTSLGISTHSTRRTFITKLHRNGTDLYTIKQITGHQDFKSLQRYVEIDDKRVEGAIAAL
jgi:integrase/recombinase XerD